MRGPVYVVVEESSWKLMICFAKQAVCTLFTRSFVFGRLVHCFQGTNVLDDGPYVVI